MINFRSASRVAAMSSTFGEIDGDLNSLDEAFDQAEYALVA
jgi:hypothetical protein